MTMKRYKTIGFILTILFLLCPLCISAKVKIHDEWNENIRCVYSDYKGLDGLGFKSLIPNPSIRVQTLGTDVAYILAFKVFVYKTTDPSYQSGDNLLVRLFNDEVLTLPLIWTASPDVMGSVAYNQTSYEPYIYPAYSITPEIIDKMVQIGIKKIRFEHSQGYADYYLYKTDKDLKRVQKNQKLMSEMWDGVKTQLSKAAPYRYVRPNDDF